MTFAPSISTLPSSAVELRDDTGELVATIYARATSIEIVAVRAVTLDSSIDMNNTGRLSVTVTRDSEERRR